MGNGSIVTAGGSVDKNGVPLHGCLELGVIGGIGLTKAEFFKKSNTYVTVTFNSELCGETEVIQSSQNPTWDATFVLPVPYGQDISLCVLELHVYHKKTDSKEVLIGYRRFAGSEIIYLGNIADELASYDLANDSDGGSEDGPPPDIGVFDLHIEHKPEDKPKKTKGKIQLIGNFHPHIAPVLVEDRDEDEATREIRELERAKKLPHKAYFSLEVQLIAAAGIANANGIAGSFQGKSNPFGIFRLNGYEVHRTAVLADTLDPVWHSETVEIRIPMGIDFLNIVFELELWHSVHPRISRRSKLLGYFNFNANQIAEMCGVTTLEVVCSAEQTHKQMMEYYENDEESDGSENSDEGKISKGVLLLENGDVSSPERPLSRGSMLRRNSSRPISRGESTAGLGRNLSRSPSHVGNSRPLSPAGNDAFAENSAAENSIDESSALSSMVNIDIFEKGLPRWLELQRHMQRPKEDALLVQGDFNMYMNFKTPPSKSEALAPLPMGKELKIAGDFNAVTNVPTRDVKRDAVLVVSVMAIRGLCTEESLAKARQDALTELQDSTSKITEKSAFEKKKPFTNTSPPPLYCAIRNMFGEIVGKTQTLSEDLSLRWQGQKFWLTFPLEKHEHFPCLFNLEVYHRSGSYHSVKDILVGETTISAVDVLRCCSHADYRLHDKAPESNFNPFIPMSGMKWFEVDKPPEELEFDGLFFNDGEEVNGGTVKDLSRQKSLAEELREEEEEKKVQSQMKHQMSTLNRGKGVKLKSSKSLEAPPVTKVVHEPKKPVAAGDIELKFQIRPPPYTEDDEDEDDDEFASDKVISSEDLYSIHSECEDCGEICIKIPCLKGGNAKDPSKKRKLGGKKNSKVYTVLYWNGIRIGKSNSPKLSQNTKFDKTQEYLIPLPLSQKIENSHLEVELFKTTPCKISTVNPLGFVTNSMGCVQLRGKSLFESIFEKRVEEENEGEDVNDDLRAGKAILPVERSHRCFSVEDVDPKDIGGFLEVTGKYTPPEKPVYTPPEEIVDPDMERELAYTPAYLTVNICEAANLGNADMLGRSDPYVVIIWNGVEEGRTSIIQNTLNPVWEDQVFRLMVPRHRDILHCTLELHVFDDNTVGLDVFLGCKVFTGPVLQTMCTNTAEEEYPPPMWLDLKPSRLLSKKQNRLVQGSLSVVFQYTDSYRKLRRYSVDHVKIELFLFAGDDLPRLHGRKKPNCFCVIRWERKEVGRTAAVRKAYYPKWDFVDENLNRFTIFFPDKHLNNDDVNIHDIEILVYHSDLCKHTEQLEDCLCLGRTILTGRDIREAMNKTSSLDSSQVEIHPYRLHLTEAHDVVTRKSKPVEPRGSLEVGLMIQHSRNRQQADREALELENAGRIGTASSHGDSALDMGPELSCEEKQDFYDSFNSSQELSLFVPTPKVQSQHRMYYSQESASFYYIDQNTNESSWDKPVDGEITLYKTEEQLQAMELAQEDFIREKEERIAHLQAVVANIRADYREDLAREALDRKLAADRVVVGAWRRALNVASREKGECNIAWQNVPVIHPMTYDFHKTYGIYLKAIRLVGCGVEVIPEEVFEKLHNLEVLTLSNNKLKSLPDSICNLFHLKHLDLKDNEITHLPARIGRLATNLARLELTNNKLEYLPTSFAALQGIERVDLTFNCIKVLPENLDLMLNLKVVKVNNNKLLRLPRCLGRMRAITSFSANSNEINYIPIEAAKCKSLEVLRLCANKISYLPENIGDLQNLKELWLDHNFISFLPTKFCMLNKLTVLHLEENRTLCSPDHSIIHQGAQCVVSWCKARYLEDEHWRRKRIIVAFQDCLRQAAEMDLCDPGKFYSPLTIKDDDYYCLDLPYFWKFILPELTKIWKRQIEEFEVVPPDVTLSFPYTKKEVMWAFKSFTDAYGYVLQVGTANFKRCLCRDENGRRRPCVPPTKGFMCRRRCHLVKHTVVLQHEKELRYWRAYKKSETEAAVARAEAEALKYLKSDAGRLWIAEMSFELAEEVMHNKGLTHRKDWRERLAEKRKNKIVKKWDKRKAKFERSKQVASAQILIQIEELKTKEKMAPEGGYAKESVGQQLAELYEQQANLPEVAILDEYTRKCDEECAKVEDDLLYTDTTDSSDNYVRETYMQRKRRRHLEMEMEARESANGAMPIMWEEPESTPISDFVMSMLDVIPPKERREKKLRRAKRRVKRKLRNTMDIVSMQYRKIKMMAIGDFKELQQELEHQTYHTHISNARAKAKRAAERQFYVIGKIRNQWKGLGLEVCFLGWKKYTKDKTKRDKADLRATYRLELKKYHADLINYRIAEAQMLMWKKYSDVYTDQPFWKHWQSHETTWIKPKIEDFVPDGFNMPKRPKPLPDGMDEDTTESEDDEHKFKPKRVFKEGDIDKELLENGEEGDDASSILSESVGSIALLKGNDDHSTSQVSASKALALRNGDNASETESTASSELTTESSLQDGSRSIVTGHELSTANVTSGTKSKNTRIIPPKNVDNDFSGQQWAPVTINDNVNRGAVSLPSILTPNPRQSPHLRSTSTTLRFPLSSSRQENVLQLYSYGPDSLRAKSMRGRIGRPLFQDNEELMGYDDEDDDQSVLSFDPGPEGQALLDAYSSAGDQSPSKELLTLDQQIGKRHW